MDRIGNYEQVYSKTFLVPTTEYIWFETFIKDWPFKCKIVFVSDNGERKLSYGGEDDHALITLFNWDHSLGLATGTPLIIADHPSGKKVSFMLVGYSIGGTKKIDVQLLLGGDNAKS